MRTVMAIAEHDPDKLYARNKGAASMSHSQLHDFASTPSAGLPEKANAKKVYGGLGGKKKK